MELHDVPANVRLQGAVVVRQIGQGHGPGADGATARTSGADPPRPGDLGRRRLRRADCLHSSRFSTRTPLFVTVSIAAYCRRCRARSCVAAVPTVLLCAWDVWGCLGVQFWVLHFLGTLFGNDFLGFRRNKGILLRQSDATSILIWFLNPEKTKISRKSRDRIGCTLHPRQDGTVVDENMMARTVLSSALPARARGAPASTSGTTPRRRLRAALARRGGSTSTSSPPPQGSLSGAVWRVDRGR